jgi:phospholipid transport system substrate-binding protein
MVTTHVSRFGGGADPDFEIEGSEDAQSGRKIVHARYLQTRQPVIPIDYIVQPTDKGSRILDVYLDGTISLLALHRSEFSSVLRDRGFDGFIAAMHAKADKLAALPDAR